MYRHYSLDFHPAPAVFLNFVSIRSGLFLNAQPSKDNRPKDFYHQALKIKFAPVVACALTIVLPDKYRLLDLRILVAIRLALNRESAVLSKSCRVSKALPYNLHPNHTKPIPHDDLSAYPINHTNAFAFFSKYQGIFRDLNPSR